MHNHTLLENYENGVICNDTSLLVLKAAKSRKVFHFGSNLKKKVPNYSPEDYPPKENILRRVIWHLFWRLEPLWKNFLRLSQL